MTVLNEDLARKENNLYKLKICPFKQCTCTISGDSFFKKWINLNVEKKLPPKYKKPNRDRTALIFDSNKEEKWKTLGSVFFGFNPQHTIDSHHLDKK